MHPANLTQLSNREILRPAFFFEHDLNSWAQLSVFTDDSEYLLCFYKILSPMLLLLILHWYCLKLTNTCLGAI